MDSFQKQPAETFKISVDFDESLNTGESISAGNSSVSAVNLAAGAADTSVYDSESLQVSGTILIVRVQAGTTDISYKITITAVTDAGNTFEKDIIMIVEDE